MTTITTAEVAEATERNRPQATAKARAAFHRTLDQRIETGKTVMAETIEKMSKGFREFAYKCEWLDGTMEHVYIGWHAEELKGALAAADSSGKPYRATLAEYLERYTEMLLRFQIPSSTAQVSNAVKAEEFEAKRRIRDLILGAIDDLDWHEQEPARVAEAHAREQTRLVLAALEAEEKKAARKAARLAKKQGGAP